MELFEAIVSRHSVRSYKPGKMIPKENLQKLCEAGRLAPTARNEQPWEFVVITESDTLKDIAALAATGRFIGDASACIAVLSKETKYYVEDGSAATAQIMLAATALGIGSCWVAGDKKDYAAEIVKMVGAPESYRLVSLISLGYPSDVTNAPKRPLDEMCHWGGYGL